jgi:hypothetical protein
VEVTEAPKEDTSRAKREAATADALAKAKAIVEAESAKKRQESEVETKAEDQEAVVRKDDADASQRKEPEVKSEVDGSAEAVEGKSAAPAASKKRGRDEAEDRDMREVKRVDSKVEGKTGESMAA